MRLAGMSLKRSSRGWLAALGTAFVLGGLLALPQGAKASLIGDSIVIETQIGNCAPVGEVCKDTVVVGPGAEVETGAGETSKFAFAFTAPFDAIVANIDVGSETIAITFNFGGGFVFLFSGLQWLDENENPVNGILNAVTSPTGGTLLSDFTVTNLVNDAGGASFRTSFNCFTVASSKGTCVAPATWILTLDVTHGEVLVPEPDTLALFGVGLMGLGLLMLRRRRQAA